MSRVLHSCSDSEPRLTATQACVWWSWLALGGLVALVLGACGGSPAFGSRPNGLRVREYYLHSQSCCGRVYVLEAGPKDAPPIVLVHGLGDNASRDYESVVPILSRDHHVLALDLPGFGLSTPPATPLSPDDYVRIIHEIVRQRISEPVTLVGHSMGGALALLFSERYPEQVSRVAVFDVAGILHFRQYVRTVADARMARQRDGLDLFRRVGHALFRIGSKPTRGSDPTKLPLPDSAALRFIQYDFSLVLRRVRVPVFLGWGAQDQVAPARTRQVLEFLLHPVRTAIYKDSEHVPMRSEPARVAADLSAFVGLSLGGLDDVSEKNLVSPGSVTTAVCRGQRGVVFEGKYESIDIDRCREVSLRRVEAKAIRIRRSRVEMQEVQVQGSSVGLVAERSKVEWTGGSVSADVCLELSSSVVSLAGVDCVYGSELVKVAGRSELLASVSTARAGGPLRSLHGHYMLAGGASLDMGGP